MSLSSRDAPDLPNALLDEYDSRKVIGRWGVTETGEVTVQLDDHGTATKKIPPHYAHVTTHVRMLQNQLLQEAGRAEEPPLPIAEH